MSPLQTACPLPLESGNLLAKGAWQCGNLACKFESSSETWALSSRVSTYH